MLPPPLIYQWQKEVADMGKAIFLAALGSSLASTVVTILILTLALPLVVDAQGIKIAAPAFAVVGNNGIEQLSLDARPTGGGLAQVKDGDGTVRVQISTGG